MKAFNAKTPRGKAAMNTTKPVGQQSTKLWWMLIDSYTRNFMSHLCAIASSRLCVKPKTYRPDYLTRIFKFAIAPLLR